MGSVYGNFTQQVRESACIMLKDPGALSDFFITEALERGRLKDINIRDAKELIKDYLDVLCDSR